MPEHLELVDCSFCGRPNREVHMVAGREGLHICSVCVEKCAAILDDDAGVPSPEGGWTGRWPLKHQP
ncbi:MAG: ClpX C4-type zinc finger protein [Ilumatobacteraceae bacterium]